MKTDIIGLAKLNLEPAQADYLRECVAAGKVWFVTRKRSAGRCIQASGETRERVQRCLNGWLGHDVTLIKIEDGKVTWPDTERKEKGK